MLFFYLLFDRYLYTRVLLIVTCMVWIHHSRCSVQYTECVGGFLVSTIRFFTSYARRKKFRARSMNLKVMRFKYYHTRTKRRHCITAINRRRSYGNARRHCRSPARTRLFCICVCRVRVIRMYTYTYDCD